MKKLVALLAIAFVLSVKVHYDSRRWAICTEDHVLTSWEVTQ